MFGLPSEWYYTGSPGPMANWLAVADMPYEDYKAKYEFVQNLGGEARLFAVFASSDDAWEEHY